MAIFPRPSSPTGAAGDLWTYLRERRSHKWPLLGVSVAITWVIMWGFQRDAKDLDVPKRDQIIYIQNWDTHRSDAQIILQQKMDLAESEARMRGKQKQMQKVADYFGIEWRSELERNNARHAEALKQLNAQLDKRLAVAETEGKSDAARPAKAATDKPAASPARPAAKPAPQAAATAPAAR